MSQSVIAHKSCPSYGSDIYLALEMKGGLVGSLLCQLKVSYQ